MPPNSLLPPGTRTVTVLSEDGVALSGIVVPAARPGPLTFVVAHGFTNSVARPSFHRLAGCPARTSG